MTSEIEEILDEVDQKFKSLKRFEVVSALPDDHHFLNNRWQTFLCGLRISKIEQETQLRKRMEQECEILETNLPNSMYVQAYESRRDLMRAVVIGLKGSPYSYGLFFFDIFFPRAYPSKPPQIFHHHNYALSKMNSSLSYSYNGNNCSVLYDGLRSTWNSKTSNVLTLLKYIQDKVLMTSEIYSKDVDKEFLLSHKAMLNFLRFAPSGFEDFVKGYFRKYSHDILLKFKGKGSSNDKNEISKMFTELYNAFEMNGSYCKHLVNVLDKDVPRPSRMSSAKNA
ncbi:hypothetical protein RND81_07G007900 [Saponaria officinalis]|uniref:UBC core domain-containing protein n=1 Tax=Saponaria officinalis TaxID=3572 RepID=A0AAW1JL55_SAPOF